MGPTCWRLFGTYSDGALGGGGGRFPSVPVLEGRAHACPSFLFSREGAASSYLTVLNLRVFELLEGHATRLGTKKPAEKGRAVLNALDRSGAGLRGTGSPRVQRGLFLCGPPPCALGAEQRGRVSPPSLLPWPGSQGADTRCRCEECGRVLWEPRTWPVDLGLRAST